jgi:hypothetical protein
MSDTEVENLEKEMTAAEAALRQAQDMPPGEARIAALRKAGQMRFDASKKKPVLIQPR